MLQFRLPAAGVHNPPIHPPKHPRTQRSPTQRILYLVMPYMLLQMPFSFPDIRHMEQAMLMTNGCIDRRQMNSRRLRTWTQVSRHNILYFRLPLIKALLLLLLVLSHHLSSLCDITSKADEICVLYSIY